MPGMAAPLALSTIGLGCGSLGDGRLSDDDAARLVAKALDLGLTLFDAARSYGMAEERLGRALAGRSDVVVATKGGYGVDGVADWTPDCVRRGVDDARRRLQRDVLDVFHLHSCPADVIPRVVDALRARVDDGAVRCAGYSGDGAGLSHAAASSAFDVVECSYSPVDQAARASMDEAAARGAGVVVKRALMNACWRHDARPDAHDVATYWDRARAMDVAGIAAAAGIDVDELCVRHAAHARGVSSVLIGTTSAAHLERAVRAAARGPLPDDVSTMLRAQFDPSWTGVV